MPWLSALTRDFVPGFQPWTVSGVSSRWSLSVGGSVRRRRRGRFLASMTNTIPYLSAVRSIDWLLEPVEQSLRAVEDGAVIGASDVAAVVGSRRPTREEVTAVMYALGALKIIDDSTGVWHLRKRALE